MGGTKTPGEKTKTSHHLIFSLNEVAAPPHLGRTEDDCCEARKKKKQQLPRHRSSAHRLPNCRLSLYITQLM